MALDIAGNEELYQTLNDHRYHLTGRDCLYQTGQNGFGIRNVRAQGFLCWLLGLKVYVL